MSDHELLELAAKAAGIELEYCSTSGFHWVTSKYSGLWWDPLNVDGDAFRLAVNLNLCVEVNGMFVHADCRHRDNDIGYFEENSARNDGCILKATRRVITRAAAAISEHS